MTPTPSSGAAWASEGGWPGEATGRPRSGRQLILIIGTIEAGFSAGLTSGDVALSLDVAAVALHCRRRGLRVRELDEVPSSEIENVVRCQLAHGAPAYARHAYTDSEP